ncbi:MAG: Lrp/AsnC family transcriptional regulator [Nitratireductor sp.]|nr:Lrp/AsnC family transcriptional regulator [Nitratireductor sp.]
MELDNIDRRILSALLEDGRASVETVAKKVGLSPTPIRRRIKQLENEGVIKGYSANIDQALCGLSLTLHVSINLKSLDQFIRGDFEKRIKSMPEVQRCHLVTGSSAYFVVLKLKDINYYNHYLRTVIAQLPGVSGITTQVVIDTIKDKIEIQ